MRITVTVDGAEYTDDVEPRRVKNWSTHEEFPFTTVAGLTYDSGNYEAATAQARALFDYAGLRREQAERRQRQDPVQLGIGVSMFTEMCGLAPSRVWGSLGYAASGWEHAEIRVLPSGEAGTIVSTPAAVDAVLTDPTADGNADAEYRSHLARVLTRRAVAVAADMY